MSFTKQIFWRVIAMTLVISVIVLLAMFFLPHKSVDLSHNEVAIDSITMEYLGSDFAADFKLYDSRIASVDKVKLTRQDDIPIALVDYTFKTEVENGRSERQFYYFDYAVISVVRDIMEQNPHYDIATISKELHLSEPHAAAIIHIIERAKGIKH